MFFILGFRITHPTLYIGIGVREDTVLGNLSYLLGNLSYAQEKSNILLDISL